MIIEVVLWMKILLLGDARALSNSLALKGHRVTLDPGDDVDAVISDAVACGFAPEGIPLIVLGTGTVVDWAVKQKRPDAVIVKTTDEVFERLREYGRRDEDILPVQEENTLPVRAGGRFVLTYSNKGGAGKTTAAVSIARTLAECGMKTVICDFDLGGPDIATYFSLKPERGLEALARGADAVSLLQKAGENLWVLPGLVGIDVPRFTGGDLLDAVEGLRREFRVVVGDTSPGPWEKEYLHPLFAAADLVCAVTDQSKSSMEETKVYAPTLLAMGVGLEKIRLVLVKYNPKLASIREVEQAFCAGFKKNVRTLPRVVAVIPEGWEQQVKAGYRGDILHKEEWFKVAKEIAGDALRLPDEKPEKKRGGLFSWFKT